MQGCKVNYVDEWGCHEKQNSKGVEVMSATMPYESYDLFTVLPAMYTGSFEMRQGRKGVPTLALVAVQYEQPYLVVKK
ncbi:MAG: hypothetical protein PHR41_09345 [Lactococcus chungangensis]|nr:hypothetical protein [Lactococcus chungangensis]